jgi:hypothetical protein
MLVVRSSNTLGYARMALARVEPPSTVVRTPVRHFWNVGFSWLAARISLVRLLLAEDVQTLHQRQAGVDHDRELAEEDGDVLGSHLAGAERRQREFLAFLLDRSGDGDALTAKLGGQHLLVLGGPFP